MRAAVALTFVAGAIAQGPGNGVSKTTYASSQPEVGLAFVLKYLPTTCAEDSCNANYCPAGTGPTGVTVQGRSQLVLPEYVPSAPNCVLFSATGATSSKSGASAITVPTQKGSDCTFAQDSYFAEASSTKMYGTFAHTADQCCKACAATAGCAGSSWMRGAPPSADAVVEEQAGRRLQGPQYYEGFGLHLVNVVGSSTAGGITVDALESAYTANLGSMESMVPFMDYSLQLFAANLTHYASVFARDGVPTYAASWPADDGKSGATWYSLFVHVPHSQMIIELMGPSSPAAASNFGKARKLGSLEARLSPRNVQRYADLKPTTDLNLLAAVSVSRATSDIAAIEKFYESVIGATKVHTLDTPVKRRCYQWGAAASDVCFTQRASDASASLSVAGFEAMMWATHASVMGDDPIKSTADKYTDNHYAVDLMGFSADKIVAYFTQNDPFPLTNATRGAFGCKQDYLIDPTGFSIQMDVSFTTGYPDRKSVV